MFQKIAAKININSLLLTFYLLFVWMTYIFCNFSQNISRLLICAIASFFPIYFIVSYVLNQLQKATFSVKKTNSPKRNIIAYGIFTSMALVISLFLYIGFRPGFFSVDSFVQIKQALNGNYSDWHPVLHTLLFYTLPLKLTHSIPFIVPFQLIFFSLVMGYMGMTLYKYAGIKYAIGSFAYILLNPFVLYTIFYPWKDVGFAFFALFSMVMAIDIYYSPRTYEKYWCLDIVLGIILAITGILRHNGILFSLPLLLALFFHLKRKNWLIILITFFVVFFLIKVPLYHILDVEKPGERVVEISGLPLTIIGNVAKETPDKMDAEMQEYVYSIATPEQWSTIYQCGNFNIIKWNGTNNEAIESAGVFHTIKIMFKCLLRSPQASLCALFTLTDLVYGLESYESYAIGGTIAPNNYGIVPALNIQISNFIQNYFEIVSSTILRYAITIGSSIVIMLSAILATTNFRKKEDIKKLFLYFPIFFYNFGTMLLLSGNDNRFFLVSFFICPVVTTLALMKKNTV